jgi:exonuclease SbcC
VAATRLEQARTRALEYEARQAALSQSLDEVLPAEIERSEAAVKRALLSQQVAQKECTQLEKQERELKTQHEALQAQLAGARAQLDTLRGQTEAFAETATRADTDLKSNLGALRDAAAGTDWGQRLVGIDAGEPLERTIRSLLDEAKLTQTEAQRRSGQIEQQLADVQLKIEKKKELEAEISALRPQHNVASDLAFVLQANHFGAFVQSEALRVLAEDGSRRLHDLSEGRYQLRVAEAGQDFEIIDRWNGDEARSVRTLSGGETFLASLALALTMAESLPGLAPGQRVALESIFIDEGFGALDPEALDRAATALDALRAKNRMVCVVTHLEELAERMPSQVQIVKSQSGSRIQLVS